MEFRASQYRFSFNNPVLVTGPLTVGGATRITGALTVGASQNPVVDTSMTGILYSASNPSGFITTGSLTPPSVSISSTVIDWSQGNVFYKTLASSSTTFTFLNTKDAQTIVVLVINPTSTYSVTWPTTGTNGVSVKWPSGYNGSAPTVSNNKADVYTFIQVGTNGIYANAVQGF
jgi:hypothetical protein